MVAEEDSRKAEMERGVLVNRLRLADKPNDAFDATTALRLDVEMEAMPKAATVPRRMENTAIIITSVESLVMKLLLKGI